MFGLREHTLNDYYTFFGVFLNVFYIKDELNSRENNFIYNGKF